MNNYKIGLYNPKIEDANGLEDCKIVFESYEKLKAHVRKEDIIILKSTFSIFGVDTKEIIDLIHEYKLKFILLEDHEEIKEKTNYNKLKIETLIGINEYIKDNLEIIKKL